LKVPKVVLAGAVLAVSVGISGCGGDAEASKTAAKPAAASRPSAGKTVPQTVPTARVEPPAIPVGTRASSAPLTKKSATATMPTTTSNPVSGLAEALTAASSTTADTRDTNSGLGNQVASSGISDTSGIGGTTYGASTPVVSAKAALLAKASIFSTHLLLAGRTFINKSGRTLAYDAYLPTSFSSMNTGPFVFVVHGGDWTDGAKEDVKLFAIALAQKGFVAIAPDYRLAPANPHPAQVNDLTDVMDYIEANPSTLFTTGAGYGAVGVGAGGHLASLVALSATATGHLSCVASVFAQTDLTSLSTMDTSLKAYLGATYSVGVLMDVSPLYRVSKRASNPSFYLSHGTADLRVPYAQSEAFAAELTRGGLKVALKPVSSGGHGYTEAQTKTTAAEIATFMTNCMATQ
jgi:acetyl esterase/lipase